MIEAFNGGYDFLSNFFLNDVYYKSLSYPSSENAFQASKCISDGERLSFTHCSPRDAKYRGREVRLRPDWEGVKIYIMLEIVRSKFSDIRLKRMLVDTHPQCMIEGNIWHDNIWGDCKCNKCKEIEGKNYLGKILMKVRKEIIK